MCHFGKVVYNHLSLFFCKLPMMDGEGIEQHLVFEQVLDVGYLDGITPEAASEIPWDDLQNMIHIWTQHLEVAVKVLYAGERRLARQVFKYLGELVWVDCLRSLAKPEMYAFIQFGESVAASHRSPEKLCALLEMFVCLEKCERSVLRVFDGQACAEIRSRYRELLKQVNAPLPRNPFVASVIESICAQGPTTYTLPCSDLHFP